MKDLVKDEYYQIKAKKGVILTTGGYSANVELLKEWNPLSLKKNVYNDSPRSNGAGITSALNVGAIRDEEPAETIFDRGLVPVGKKNEDMYYQTATYDHWLWIGSYPFLKVNLHGERFANESVPYQFIVNAAAKEPGYLYAMIWDDDYAETLEKVQMLGCARYGFPGYMKNKEKIFIAKGTDLLYMGRPIFSARWYNESEVKLMKYEAAIFDMDGTILDTSADLTSALNYAFEQTGHRHDFTVEDIKNFFGSGVVVAVTRALAYEAGSSRESLVAFGTKDEQIPEAVTQAEVNRVLEVFKPYYANHCQIKTGPFPGILDLMKNLRQKGVKLAVVSNKPNEAVQVLVEELFPGSFDFALGERNGIRRKPAPDMTSECVKVLGVPRDKCVYIGDSEIDIQTARNSEMDEIAVNWGFRSVPFLQKHGATVIVDTAEKLEEAILGE